MADLTNAGIKIDEEDKWDKLSEELCNYFPMALNISEFTKRDLEEALYALCQRGSWGTDMDIDSISVKDALRIHAVVEKVKYGFPAKFRM